MSSRHYTLDDLVSVSGFTKRQIRFYISRRLIPGSGTSRGPNAVYPAAARHRLLRIADLKRHRLPPTGRRLTLEEIRYLLDTGQEPEFHAPDLADDSDMEPVSLDRSIGDHKRRSTVHEMPASWVGAGLEELCTVYDLSTTDEQTDNTPTATELLSGLRDLLNELAADQSQSAPATEGRWRRLSTPDLEIHVRQPDGAAARVRLAGLGASLHRLLNPEDQR